MRPAVGSGLNKTHSFAGEKYLALNTVKHCGTSMEPYACVAFVIESYIFRGKDA